MSTTHLPPPPFCYEVYDLDTGKLLGGGKDFTGADAELLFVKTAVEWAVHQQTGAGPLHVEQISYEAYEEQFGRTPDWPAEYERLRQDGEL